VAGAGSAGAGAAGAGDWAAGVCTSLPPDVLEGCGAGTGSGVGWAGGAAWGAGSGETWTFWDAETSTSVDETL
jgi:hypothetical protein